MLKNLPRIVLACLATVCLNANAAPKGPPTNSHVGGVSAQHMSDQGLANHHPLPKPVSGTPATNHPPKQQNGSGTDDGSETENEDAPDSGKPANPGKPKGGS